MKKTIEKQIIKDIQYALDEINIDGMVEKATSSKVVNETVKRMVDEKLIELIQDKAFLKIKKAMPIIDAWTESKVQAFLYELGVK
jgi:hypothetical protein